MDFESDLAKDIQAVEKVKREEKRKHSPALTSWLRNALETINQEQVFGL